MNPETFLEAAEYQFESGDFACWALAICASVNSCIDTYECREARYFMALFDDGSVPENEKALTGLFGNNFGFNSNYNNECRVLALLLAYEIAKDQI